MNTRTNAGLTGVVCALSLAAGRPALGYVVAKDPNGHTEHWVGSSISFRAPAAFPDGLDATQARAAIESAAQTWSAASGLAIGVDGISEGGPGYDPTSSDNHNDIFFFDESWPYMSGVIAITIVTLDASSGALLDADIVFDAKDRQFAILPAGHAPGGEYDDVQNTATHELGHALGMAHNPDLKEATMYPGAQAGETSKRALSSDDVAGIQSIYDGQVSAVGCSAGAGGGSALAAWLVLPLALFRRRRWRPTLATSFALIAIAASPLARADGRSKDVREVLAKGRVTKSSSRWEGRRLIVTDITVRVDTCDQAPCPEQIQVTRLGGRVGNIEQIVNGESSPREGDAVDMSLRRDDRGQLMVTGVRRLAAPVKP